MKTIIISDIKGKGESIIPYGLHLAKNIESEVDIIHIIDSRAQQGVQSTYSDSQSFTPGSKLSHDEIIDRERHYAEKELDRLLSSEASRLNYPLKINTIIEVGEVEKKLTGLLNDEGKCLIIANSKHDNYIFHSQQEILEIMQGLKGVPLLVPSGNTFEQIDNILLIPNFTSEDITRIRDDISFLEPFKSHVNAVHVEKTDEFKQNEIKDGVVEDLINKRLTPFTFELNTLTGNNYIETITNYLNKTNPDLVLMVKNNKTLFEKILQKRNDKNEKLLQDINYPVLIVK